MTSGREFIIQTALDMYQGRFRLWDWDIRYDPDNELLGEDDIAETKYEIESRRAVIRISDEVPEDFLAWHVVHEMWHLVTIERQYLVNDVLSKCGDVALGVIDTLNRNLERECELVAEAVTGEQWRPIGEAGKRVFRVFDVDHSLAVKEPVSA